MYTKSIHIFDFVSLLFIVSKWMFLLTLASVLTPQRENTDCIIRTVTIFHAPSLEQGPKLSTNSGWLFCYFSIPLNPVFSRLFRFSGLTLFDHIYILFSFFQKFPLVIHIYCDLKYRKLYWTKNCIMSMYDILYNTISYYTTSWHLYLYIYCFYLMILKCNSEFYCILARQVNNFVHFRAHASWSSANTCVGDRSCLTFVCHSLEFHNLFF